MSWMVDIHFPPFDPEPECHLTELVNRLNGRLVARCDTFGVVENIWLTYEFTDQSDAISAATELESFGLRVCDPYAYF